MAVVAVLQAPPLIVAKARTISFTRHPGLDPGSRFTRNMLI